MKKVEFKATLLTGHKSAAVEIPFDPAKLWSIPATKLRPGRRGHRVRGELKRVSFESSIVPRSGKFFLLVADELLEAASASVGDAVDITVWPLIAPS